MHLDGPHRSRAPLLWLALPFAVGIGAAHAQAAPWAPATLITVALTASTGAVLLQRPRPRTALGLAAVALVAAGALHLERHRQRLPAWDALPSREAELHLRVDRAFRVDDQSERLSLIGTVTQAPPHLQDLVGQSIYAQARRFHQHAPVLRGGTISLRGQLEPMPRHPPPEETEGFFAYLIDNGVNFRLVRGRLLSAKPPNSAYARWRAHWARELALRLNRGLEAHPSLAGPLTAMVLGQRGALDDDARNLFLRSGTMHLFAISGLHIGVIALGLHWLLRLLPIGRLATMLAGCTLLGFYVDLIGLPPSAVRAWLMVVCLQLARVCRAPHNSISAIAASALLVLLLDPLQLFSAGFQMSYGIVLALLLYGLPLGRRWRARFRWWRDRVEVELSQAQRRWRARWEDALTTVAMAWAATLVGLVAGVAFFGWFSPLSLLANLLLIPLACIVIKCGFIALVAAAAGFTPMVLLFNHAAALVLLVMQGLLARGMSLPGAAWPAGFVQPWWGPAAICSQLALMAWGYSCGWQGRGGSPWGPPALAAVVLVSGMRIG